MFARILCVGVIGLAAGGICWRVAVTPGLPQETGNNSVPGTPGVTYSSTGIGGRKLPNAGPGTVYLIYSVTSEDGKTMQIHGANKSGQSLLNASAHKVRRVFGRYAGFDPSVTFETVYPANSQRVGRWTGGSMIIGALSDHTGVCGHGYSVVPPKLPGDGETVSITPADLLPGDDALSLTFGTYPETTTFLIVGQPAAAMDSSPPRSLE